VSHDCVTVTVTYVTRFVTCITIILLSKSKIKEKKKLKDKKINRIKSSLLFITLTKILVK